MINSPCRKKCQLNEDKTFCVSCLRKIEEISSWNSLNDNKKKVIINLIKKRKFK